MLWRLGKQTLELGVLHRLHGWGFGESDILRYLPGGDDLVRRKADLLSYDIQKAAGELDEIHIDLVTLVDKILSLSGARQDP